MTAATRRSGVSGVQAAGRIFVLLVSPGLAFLVPMALVPAITAMSADFARTGSGPLAAQLVLVVPAILSMVSAPLVSVLALRWGKRPSFLAALLLYGLTGSIGIAEPGLPVLLVGRCLQGISAGALVPLSMWLIGDYYRADTRERLLGLASTTQMGVAVVAMPIAGWLVEHHGWGAAFYCYVPALLILAVAWFALDEPTATAIEPEADARQTGITREVRPLFGSYGLLFLIVFGLFMIPVQGPLLLADVGIAGAVSQGIISALPNIGAMAGGVTYALLYRLASPVSLLSLALALSGAALVAMGYLPQETAVLLTGYVAVGWCAGMAQPALSAVVIARISDRNRGAALGLAFSIVSIAQFLNPLFVGPIRAAVGIRAAFVVVGVVLPALAVVGMLLRLAAGKLRKPAASTA